MRALDALTPRHLTGAQSCLYEGNDLTALLAYPDGHTVTIIISATSCAFADNGHLVRAMNHQLLKELERLTGYRGRVL